MLELNWMQNLGQKQHPSGKRVVGVAAAVGHWEKLEEEEDIQGVVAAVEVVVVAAERQMTGLIRHHLSVVLVEEAGEGEEGEEVLL